VTPFSPLRRKGGGKERDRELSLGLAAVLSGAPFGAPFEGRRSKVLGSRSTPANAGVIYVTQIAALHRCSLYRPSMSRSDNEIRNYFIRATFAHPLLLSRHLSR